MTIVYLNGDYLPIEHAQISVLDRGFLLGDGVYEVIPYFGGNLFRLKEHLDRLYQSLADIQLPIPQTHADLTEILNRVATSNKGLDQSIYLQITRGNDPNPVRRHIFPNVIHPTLFVSSSPLVSKTKAELRRGDRAITLPDLRWSQCSTKAISLLANVLASQRAKEQGSIDAILIREGYALEGSTSNFFIIKQDTLITTPLNNFILGGVTRSLTLELARDAGVSIEERPVLATELFEADELWLTSSTKDILPITQLDQHHFPTVAGPLWNMLIDRYLNYREHLRGQS